MRQLSLLFTAPGKVEVREQILPPVPEGQVRVESLVSAVSPGSEGLVYRGQFPPGLTVDETLPALAGKFVYPLQYGYSLVGRVKEAGLGVDRAWEGRLVFSFHPHESHFHAPPAELILLPDGLPPEEAVFLANMETAVNFLLDSAPLVGENVVVFGQGIVGLLTTALLCRYPLSNLVTLDRYAKRRQASRELQAGLSLDPYQPEALQLVKDLMPEGADLAYELSGSPAALQQAIEVTGFAGRIVIGSWYGQKKAELDLGGSFHRSRIQLISSQVSSLSPTHTGRWNKQRRWQVAWGLIAQIRPSRWITHRLPLSEASRAYRLLEEEPQEAIQLVFTYNG